MRLVFDIETNGLRPKVNTIHCIVAMDIDTNTLHIFRSDSLGPGLKLLQEAELLIGHNISGYDIPVIRDLMGVDLSQTNQVDTSAVSRAMFVSTLKDGDFKRLSRGFPKHLVGRHSLEAWGHRLGLRKGDFGKTSDWSEFSEEMLDYCIQDVKVNKLLFRFLLDFERVPGRLAMPIEAMYVESRVHGILTEQQDTGIAFDEMGAAELAASLQTEKAALTEKLKAIYGPEWISKGEFTPKRDNKKRGYGAGCLLTKIELREFNPGSDQQVGERLVQAGWEPAEFTPGGQPKVDESSLIHLDLKKFRGVGELLRYKLVSKRLGQIFEGKTSWLSKVEEGRIHHKVQSTGARTGRMSASSPNLQQVPRVGSYLGAECRRLFGPGQSGWLVGIDASGLELRTLANRMHPFDGGKFSRVVVDGDVHEMMRQASGLHSRNRQKTFTYAMLYGAGHARLGMTVSEDMRDAGVPVSEEESVLGRRTHKRLVSKLAGLQKLLTACKSAHSRGYLRLVNGLHVQSISEHSALNTLLQGDGAVIMKVSQYLLDRRLREIDELKNQWAFVLTVHDEFQLECRTELAAKRVGEVAVKSIRDAGKLLNMKVDLDAEYSVGHTWEDTH